MLIIKCPWCGERDQTEFSYGGEAHIARPLDPDAISDEDWGDYIFFRSNPRGWHYERWTHAHGCRRWFNALRHTVTDRFVAFYKSDEPRPSMPEEDG